MVKYFSPFLITFFLIRRLFSRRIKSFNMFLKNIIIPQDGLLRSFLMSCVMSPPNTGNNKNRKRQFWKVLVLFDVGAVGEKLVNSMENPSMRVTPENVITKCHTEQRDLAAGLLEERVKHLLSKYRRNGPKVIGKKCDHNGRDSIPIWWNMQRKRISITLVETNLT